LRGGLDNKSKFHLVNWKNVCTLLNFGGLGIRSLLTINQPLFESGYEGMLWRKRLFSSRLSINKYGSLVGDWCSKVATGSYGVTVVINTEISLKGTKSATQVPKKDTRETPI
jgi:hypothetical protein